MTGQDEGAGDWLVWVRITRPQIRPLLACSPDGSRDCLQANFQLANDGGGHTDVTYNGTGLAAVGAEGSGANGVQRMA